jgi:hypothetical protein
MAKKTRLSPELERGFNHRNLKPEEVDRLRAMATAYQEFIPVRWPERDFELYHTYFGFLTALKAKSAILEMYQYGLLSKSKNYEVVELGPGTLGASLGVCDALRDFGSSSIRARGIDVQESAFRWAKSKFSAFLPSAVEYLRNPPRLEQNADRIIIAANFLIEIKDRLDSDPLVRWLEEQFEQLSGRNLFLFIEPAEFEFNQKFLALRDLWSQKIRVLLPCTHQKACPAKQQSEWCHEDRAYEAPSAYWNMVHQLGFRQKNLSFSYLVLGKQTPPFQDHHARVVSDDVSGKGLAERWLCAQGRRWKQSALLRHQSEETLSFYESQRGDIVDLRIFEDSRQH